MGIMSEADRNGQGKITYDDFKDVMINYKKADTKMKKYWSL